jgi:uncharacterized membrane-anchored protein
MLLLVDQPEDARVAFEASLKVSKNRLNSLSGAGRSAELSGDREAAMEYYSQVIELVNQRSDVSRPRLEDARRLASSTKG